MRKTLLASSILLAAGTLVLASPASARCDQCVVGAVNNANSNISGTVAETGNSINQTIASYMTQLSDVLRYTVTTNRKLQTEADVATADANNKLETDRMRQQVEMQTKSRYTINPETCYTVDAAAGLSEAGVIRTAVKQNMASQQARWSGGSSGSASAQGPQAATLALYNEARALEQSLGVEKLAEATPILYNQMTWTDDQVKLAEHLTRMVVDPLPPSRDPNRPYTKADRLNEDIRMLRQQIISEPLMAWKASRVEGVSMAAWKQGALQYSGIGEATSSGKISYADMIDTAVRYRIENPSWVASLQGSPENVMRDIAMQLALTNKILLDTQRIIESAAVADVARYAAAE